MYVYDQSAITTSYTWAKSGPRNETIVTYSLNTVSEPYWRLYEDPTFVSSFSSAKPFESVIREAFDLWEQAGNIQLVQVDGNEANISIGLFDFSRAIGYSDFVGFAYFPSFNLDDNSIGGDIFVDADYANFLGLWLHEIGHSLGLTHPHTGTLLHPDLDNTSRTVMSYEGTLPFQLGDLDIAALRDMYGSDVRPNMVISEYEMQTGDRSKMLQQLRDYDGNLFAATNDWKLIGFADVDADGDDEFIFTNATLGRWATLGPDQDGMIDFANHGFQGDTRVVGIYIDPLVELGLVQRGSDFDSQQRFQNDLLIDNLRHVGTGDFDRDGLQNLYFKTADGTAYLNAKMHADGNIQYANYQSQDQMVALLQANGWDYDVYDDWLVA